MKVYPDFFLLACEKLSQHPACKECMIDVVVKGSRLSWPTLFVKMYRVGLSPVFKFTLSMVPMWFAFHSFCFPVVLFVSSWGVYFENPLQVLPQEVAEGQEGPRSTPGHQ